MTHRTPNECRLERAALRAALGALPLAVAVVCAGSSLANPAGQPGSTSDGQPGSTSDGQPGSTSAPHHHHPSTPVTPHVHHAPQANPHRSEVTPVEPPIPSSDKMIQIGYINAAAPEWIPEDIRHQVNTTAADADANVLQFAQSVGLPSARAHRFADSVITGAAAGFAVAATPGALIGGACGIIPGAIIGGIVGLIGFVVGAIPGVVVGGTAGAVAVGATLGTATGMTFGVVPGALIGAAAGLAP